MPCHFINNIWVTSEGAPFHSVNPATGAIIWSGHAATKNEVDMAVNAAVSIPDTPLEKRISYVETFQKKLLENKEHLAQVISEDTGKPLWEAKTEVEAMSGKVAISIEAYAARCKEVVKTQGPYTIATRHKPLGALAVFGPFNFPGHLPNGHIIPAIIAGNSVILKPSELTPLVAESIMHIWEECRLPKGVINMVQGGVETGELLAQHPLISGLLFTGSYPTGLILSKLFSAHPEKILALEMGGNNPYVIGNISDLKTAAYFTIQSAYLTSGQRCSCARRLIVPEGKMGDQFLEILISQIRSLTVAPYTQSPEPFMGPVITKQAGEKLLKKQEELLKNGGKALVEMKGKPPLLTPGLIDVTDVIRKDEEIFGPLLQLIRVPDFAAAIEEANRTAFGLSAGLLSDDPKEYELFYKKVRAGVINWNTPLTGASSHAPFGGIGLSGNHRPSAFYAADYCSYPVASSEAAILKPPQTLLPGTSL